MQPESPLHEALAAWRAAERRLARADAGDPARGRLKAEVDRLRTRYQATFEEIEDVAGHGAPFTDDPVPEPRPPRR